MNQPLVSIITPSYNKEKFIRKTIDSVKEQSFTNWELIIVDDASTDGTKEMLERASIEDNSIRIFINHANKGGNYCRNKGIEEAQGKYLLFLDADDMLDKQCLKGRVAFMESNPELDFAVFTMQVFYKAPGDSQRKWIPDTKQALYDFLAHKLPWQTMQPIWKKSFIEKIEGFDLTFPRLQDVELHTKALLQKEVQFKTITAKPDCFYRIDEERKNYNHYDFLRIRIEATILYYNKFYKLALQRGIAGALMGTIYHSYLQLLWFRKQHKINGEEFAELETKLFGIDNLKKKTKPLFFLTKMYNRLPVSVPGINWSLNKLIKL